MQHGHKTIVLVDDQALNLTIGKHLLKDLYKVYTIPSAALLFNLLESVIPDLILLDVMMPDMSGYDAIKALKNNPEWADIPVIFLTACADEESELTGLSLGAVDYIMKPFSAPLLRKRIENQILAEERRKNLQKINGGPPDAAGEGDDRDIAALKDMLGILADAAEFRNGVSTGHAARVRAYMDILLDAVMEEGKYKAEVSEWDSDSCALAAQFHDIGKAAVGDAVLNKREALTEEEFSVVKTHVAAGLQMLSGLETAANELPLIAHTRRVIGGHHERWDGSGYPAGLKGGDIPLEGRLMAVADVYDALISPRPHRGPYSLEEARAYIEKGGGTEFDPELVRLFSKRAGLFESAAKQGVR